MNSAISIFDIMWIIILVTVYIINMIKLNNITKTFSKKINQVDRVLADHISNGTSLNDVREFVSEVYADTESEEQKHATEVLNEKIKWVELAGYIIIESGIKIIETPNHGSAHKVFVRYVDKNTLENNDTHV